jgi:flagellar biogenesis protein FliO
MELELVMASIDRAGDHAAVVLGVLAVIAAVVGLVYLLVRLVGKSRAGRTHSDRASGPEA